MPHRCLLYYISDRNQFSGTEAERRSQLLEKIKEAAAAGVDYIQVREKDLCARELEGFAREAVSLVRSNSLSDQPTRILINSRTDVALAAEADGVHLRSDDIPVSDARKIWISAQTAWSGRHSGSAQSMSRPLPLIAVSCHKPAEVQTAEKAGADFVVFGPIFEKKDAPSTQPAGLEALRQACQYKIPVLALGGVTLENAAACLDAGAAGIAAIRLFQENNIGQIVARLSVRASR